MLQRNTLPEPVDVPAISATVEPGGTVDWPTPLVGFQPVDTPDTDTGGTESSAPGAAEGPAPDADPKPKTTRKAPPAGKEQDR